MSWIAKARHGDPGRASTAATTASASASSPASNRRVSNGLKEFLWLISDAKRGRILDLGPASQPTIGFFTEKGFGISAEDFLRAWRDFLGAEEDRIKRAPAGSEVERLSGEILAERFLQASMKYPPDSFNGVLAWDLLDYAEPPLATRMMARLYDMLRPGGVVLALFHSRPAERFYRYRIADGQTIELLPAPLLATQVRVFQNREILDLFGQFRSSKTFVGRDQLREALFLK
jgi:hypothetical protein